MLFVEWRGNHQIALDTADQPATDDIRPGLRVMIIDGIEGLAFGTRQVEQRHLGTVQPDDDA
ncbi:hypothetical protein D9M72_591240 [compost metagenome]